MKLLELEIRNIRGIRELSLSPNGENVVIWGPNGSGKSAVVDAVDFLLTGKISRLTGEGTGAVSLKTHGPHIDQKAQDAWVRAVVSIPGHDNPIPLRRVMSSPAVLEHPPEAAEVLRPILDLATKGQHVLSRREILKYVAAEPGKRAGEVQALLNLGELEEMRKALVRAARETKKEHSAAEGAVATAERAIASTLRLNAFAPDSALAEVNKIRGVLGAGPITQLQSATLKEGTTSPSSYPSQPPLNTSVVRQTVSELQKMLEATSPQSIGADDGELRSLLKELRSDADMLRKAESLRLLELGISMIPSDGTCPLCGTRWPAGKLHRHLETHVADARAIAEKKKRIHALSGKIATVVRTVLGYVEQCAAAGARLSINNAQLTTWSENLRAFSEVLADPIQTYHGTYAAADAKGFLASKSVRDALHQIDIAAERISPALSPHQTAWDTLTRLEENWRAHANAVARGVASTLASERAMAVEECFEEARDHVLESLYAQIEIRFSELYRAIHCEDEPAFQSSIRPHGAGLIFEVDFYGRGKFPPMAYHSEGHQDTMGLCLYLALAERLTAGCIDLTILDDVVMSVDSAHRRQICTMLSTMFPGRQFLITTHDKTWARQLVTTGVAPRKNSVEFSRWRVETGPQVFIEAMGNDFWSKIQRDIEADDIPASAARLRRGAEEFFEHVCDRLRGSVIYRSDGRWELGDFVAAAIGAYRKYLREAKTVAQSWKNTSGFDKVQELETVAAQIIARSQVEQWVVNENVHYNRWGEFSAEDFQPVADAWRDLFALFICPGCESTLFVTLDGKDATALRCKCGAVNWNLLKKSAAHAK